MKLLDFKVEEKDGVETRSCQVYWEDSKQSSFELYFESPSIGHYVDVNAFLLAAFLPALHCGEKRVYVEGNVAPCLVDNLYTAASWISHWRTKKTNIPIIEAEGFKQNNLDENAGSSGGVFLSGGVDSLSTLIRTSRLYPERSPHRVTSAILTFGTTIKDFRSPELTLPTFYKTVERLDVLAQRFNITLMPVKTNIFQLNSNIPFWVKEYHACAFSAVAHAVSCTRKTYFLAATNDIRYIEPWGSHPLLDRLYSSDRVTFVHDGERLSRLEKLKEITDELSDISFLRVCNRGEYGQINCGKCEKCVRTKLELLALGKFNKELFVDGSLSPDLVKRGVDISNGYRASCYLDVLPGLRGLGEVDIVKVIKKKLWGWRVLKVMRGMTKLVLGIDNKVLGGVLRYTYEKVSR